MRKPFVTTGVLFIGLIAILGAIGIVNGLWSKNLVINGTVTTGDLNADWNCGYANDDGSNTPVIGAGLTCPTSFVETVTDNGQDPTHLQLDYLDAPGFSYPATPVSKDVGHCTLAIGDTTVANPTASPPVVNYGNQVAYVTISNAYPSYECTVSLELSNTGSIPFNVIGLVAAVGNNGDGIELLTASEAGVVTASNTCTSVGGAQVDPGQDKTVTCTIHVKETAWQSTCTASSNTDTTGGFVQVTGVNCGSTPQTYHFVVNSCVAQWNEAATFDACKASLQHEGPASITPLDPSPKTGPNVPTS